MSMENNPTPRSEKSALIDALRKLLPALITGLIIGFGLVLFSHH
jgi:hypothetical protein